MSENIKNISLLDFCEKAIYIHGSYVVEHRALPDIRDGLKPVHRRILWAMKGLNLYSSGGPKKTARTVGEVIGKYHPHGDASVADAMAKMVNLPEPLISGQGNFGNYEASPAAPRYTESKLSKYAENFLLDPDYLAVVPMVQNYDGEFQEPVYLPSKLPNLLINGSEGIATGCVCLVPSFTKKSVTKVVRLGLKGKKITSKLCTKHLNFKFTYGGEECNETYELKSYFKTGNGSLYFIPDYEDTDDGLKIKSIAPRFRVGQKLEKLAGIKGVSDVEDNRELGKIEFLIRVNKRNRNREKILDKIKDSIITSLPCQTTITKRHDDGEHADFFRTNIPKFLEDWIKYRIDLEEKVVKRLEKIEKEKLLRQEWLLFAINHRKEIIQALEKKNPKKFLMKSLKIEEDLADFILDLKVRNLAKLEAKKIKDKIFDHKGEIKSLKDDLKNIEKRILRQLEEK